MFIYGWIFFIYIYIWPVWDSDKQLPDISVLAAKLSSCWQQTYFAAGMGPSLVKIIPASQSVKKKKKKKSEIGNPSRLHGGCLQPSAVCISKHVVTIMPTLNKKYTRGLYVYSTVYFFF